MLPGVGGDDGLEDLRGVFPELVVLGTEDDEDAVGLGVEGGGNVEDGVLDDLLDAVLGDGEFLVEDVVGAADLEEVEDRLGLDWGSHLGAVGRGGRRGVEGGGDGLGLRLNEVALRGAGGE